MIAAMVLKELHHHYQMVLGTSILFAASISLALGMMIATERGTLLGAASSLAYWALPMVIALVLRRLVVMEYEQGTHDFLAALPGTAVVRAGVKYALGLLFVQALALGALVLIAALVSGQELISVGFFFQVTVQIVVYVWAWYGLTFFAAHLGRYRFAFWLLLLPAVLTLAEIEPDAFELYLWQAALALPLDETRTAFPVYGVAMTSGWALAASVCGLALAGVQQGAMAAGWFRPMTTREKTTLVVVVFSSWLGLDLLDDLNLLGGPVYTQVPAVHDGPTVVRVTAAEGSHLWRLGERVCRELDELSVDLNTAWPTVVLVPVVQRAERPVDLRSEEHGEIVLEVDLKAGDDRVLRSVLDWVLADHGSTQNRRRPSRAWIASGAPRWILGGPGDGAFALRAAVAAGRIASADELVDSLELEHRLGADLFAAVGWVGLQVVADQAGDDAVDRLLAEVLGPKVSPGLAGAVWVDLERGDAVLRRTTGLEPGAFRVSWMRALRDLQVAHEASVRSLELPDGALRRESGEEAGVIIVSELVGEPVEGLQIAWTELDPLHSRPQYSQEWQTRDVDAASQRVPTPVDPRARVAMRYELFVPKLEGDVAFGLVVDP